MLHYEGIPSREHNEPALSSTRPAMSVCHAHNMSRHVAAQARYIMLLSSQFSMQPGTLHDMTAQQKVCAAQNTHVARLRHLALALTRGVAEHPLVAQW